MFSIFDVAIGDAALALCPLPGRFSPYLNDFAAILAWRPDLVLSLTERSEMKPVGAADFPADLKAILNSTRLSLPKKRDRITCPNAATPCDGVGFGPFP